ncbi:MAG: calcium-binding protein, partial [Hyphomicrobiaceae bacterium]
MSWSILGLQSAVSKTATEYVLSSNDFGGSQVRLTGTGFTYDAVTGFLTGGSIAGAALIKNGEIVQTVAFTTALSGASFNNFFAPAASLRAQVLGWGATAADVAEYESPNSLRIYAQNGTSVVFEGSGFSSFTNNGTVTAMKHYGANGVLLQTVTTGMPMALGVAAAAIGGDRGWYHYLVAGNNTVTQVSSNYVYEIDGGTGNDTIVGPTSTGLFVPLSYKQALGAESIDLTAGTATGAMGTDTLTNIQHVLGSNFNDNITGNGNANYIDGDLGNDTLSGLAGDDRLYGNLGDDTLLGGVGNDLLGGGMGDDIINGGDGVDTADYEDYNGSVAGVTVSLLIAGPQNTGGQGIDTLVGIEHINGSIYADTLTGNGGNNLLVGNTGNDTLNGGAGEDILQGDAGNDYLNGGVGDDFVSYRSATS